MDSFFGIGLPELILILAIAGVFMGPERIGLVARWLGKTTAQLQTISRGFMKQLQNELDGIDDGAALQDAMTEVQALRQELESLRSDFTNIATTATNEGKEAIKDIENSIRPPSLTLTHANEKKDQPAAVANGKSEATKEDESTASSELPNLVEISDDPE